MMFKKKCNEKKKFQFLIVNGYDFLVWMDVEEVTRFLLRKKVESSVVTWHS